MEPLLDKSARKKKHFGWIIWSLCISFLWFWVLGFVALAEDDGSFQPHPYLDAVLDFMTFPLCHLPRIGDSDGILIPSCLLWGFFLVWLFRFVVRQFTTKKIGKHEK
jgi:hypothetical protein